jgi:uncharacterized protein
MRILIDMGHPGHVHFYRHALRELERRGHELLICARDKDVTLSLLDHYQFPYQTFSNMGHGTLGMSREFLAREWGLMRTIKSFNPDVVTAIGGLFIAPACRMMGKPSIVFTDSEPVPFDNYLTYPFATLVCTPDCFLRELKCRHLRYPGYHELAYLHPKRFKPDPSILKEMGITEKDPFILLRFVAWKATHDIGQHGFDLSFKIKLIEQLSQYGRVLISSESPLPPELEPHRFHLPPHRIHHALYYARLFMGDGATMATEAALLGTPTVRSSSMALNMGNFIELMTTYHLVLSYQDAETALLSALQLLNDDHSKSTWKERRNRLLTDKIDVTAYMVDLIENHADHIQ